MEPIEAIPARSPTGELIGTGFNSQIGDEIQRLISVPPESGSSFTALLELPANQAMELLIHSSEDAATIARNPSATIAECRTSPPAPLPIFPSDAALVERASKFSSIMSSDEISSSRLGIVKEELLDTVSNPNSNSSPAVSNPAFDQNTSSTKRKDRAKKGKESNKKCKKPASESSDDGGEKLPYVHVRARRGQATDRHSLAERARREKINARMKLLQELVPGCNKISGTAMVLDEIINHVQSLQRQVEFLSMRLATVNPRVDFDFDTLLATESRSHVEMNFPGMMMPSMWPEGQVHMNREQYQQPWPTDELHQPVWVREADNSNFITPENSLLSYNSSANSAPLHPNQVKMEM